MVSYDLGKVVGDAGAAGKGIVSISKTGASGLVDTYTIVYSDDTSSTFTVTNGAKGDKGDKGNKGDKGDTGDPGSVDIVTSWESTLSDIKVPSEKLVKNGLDAKSASTHTHGNITNDGKVGTSSGKPLVTTTGGAVTTGAFGSSAGQFAEGNHTHSGMLTSSDVANNLTTTTSGKVLDARQGKALADLIGNAIQYINM